MERLYFHITLEFGEQKWFKLWVIRQETLGFFCFTRPNLEGDFSHYLSYWGENFWSHPS